MFSVSSLRLLPMRCMYIFNCNRNGVCFQDQARLRPRTTISQQQAQKLMLGLLFSLKSFTSKMDSDPSVVTRGASGCRTCRVNSRVFVSQLSDQTCKLSFMESPRLA